MAKRLAWVISLAVTVFANPLSGGLPAQEIVGQETTAASRQALDRGLQWLAANQGPEGNWGSNDLGLVSLGLLAYLSDGHFPERGRYGVPAQRALSYVVRNGRSDGLLNIAQPQRDMYNHGLATFVLGQAHGMANDGRLGRVLDQALQLIAATQCNDGGWDYRAEKKPAGHDLSLVVMQAKALRSAVDSGFEVAPQVVQSAIRNVREHYVPENGKGSLPEPLQQRMDGQFSYLKRGSGRSIAMAAAGVVCLQEFGEYDDWRIEKNMEVIFEAVNELQHEQEPRWDPYTLYYVAQAAYQVGDPWWSKIYPTLRDYLVRVQRTAPQNSAIDGKWVSVRYVAGAPGDLYATSVACFVLAIPNRYLPILQEGRIEGIRQQFR